MSTTTCTFADCERKHDARGYCASHYNRWKRYGDPLGSAPKTVRLCDVDGCERPHRSWGYCNMHAQRLYKHGDATKTIMPTRKPCTVDGCETLARYSGYCVRHFRRVQKHGDPNTVADGGRPTIGSQPMWAAVHKRLDRQRGKARAHGCVDCGKRAAEWSYDNADPNELRDDRIGSPYSLDLNHYQPRCIPCHRRFDMASAKTMPEIRHVADKGDVGVWLTIRDGRAS